MQRLISLLFLFLLSSHTLAKEPLLDKLHLPPGFTISLYAYPIPNARSMTLGSKDIVFVGTREEGKVYALLPDSAKHKAKVLVLASDLTMPNGVAFYNHDLYVAEMNRILRFADIEKHLTQPPTPTVITADLPNKTHHGWRYLAIGPDKKFYVSIGAPCNVCTNSDKRFASIMRMNVDGTQQEVFASGVRNSVGFDWNPVDHTLWFTDNGRDWMGDNEPPDELNHAPTIGLNFGFPYCHGKNILDPQYGRGHSCSSFTPPVLALPAHVATLGMRFYHGKMFPANYQNQIFIAEHGSWNRSTKVGYQILAVTLTKDNKIKDAKPFITGWLHQDSVWGRPVDVLVMRDGSLLISDDDAGAIYRVTYS